MVERRDADADARADSAQPPHQCLVTHHQSTAVDETEHGKGAAGRQIKIQALLGRCEWRRCVGQIGQDVHVAVGGGRARAEVARGSG